MFCICHSNDGREEKWADSQCFLFWWHPLLVQCGLWNRKMCGKQHTSSILVKITAFQFTVKWFNVAR